VILELVLRERARCHIHVVELLYACSVDQGLVSTLVANESISKLSNNNKSNTSLGVVPNLICFSRRREYHSNCFLRCRRCRHLNREVAMSFDDEPRTQ